MDVARGSLLAQLKAVVGATGRRRRLGALVGSGLAVVTLAGTGALVGLAPGTAGATKGGTNATCTVSSTKCYSVSVTPQDPGAGTRTTFAFHVTDLAPTQQLGSLQITAPATPAGVTISGATGPTGSTPAVTPTAVVFKTLGIAAGTSATLTVTAELPCQAGPYTWSISARQSNQFNGPPGNYMVLTRASANNLHGAITGSCTLEFVTQPKGTTVTSVITGTFDTPSGTAVGVGVYTPTGTTLLRSFSGSISMSLTGGATQTFASGSTTGEPVVNGIASFANLSIGTPGTYYQLEASGAGTTAYSLPFSIYSTLNACTTKHCSATTKSGPITVSSTASTTTTGFLGVSLGKVATFSTLASCGSYTLQTTPTATGNIDVLTTSGTPTTRVTTWTASVEILKSLTKQLGSMSPHSWQICIASTKTFTTATGTPATTFTVTAHTVTPPQSTTYYYGLIPTCSSTPVAPCVLSSNKDKAGDVVITFLPWGDMLWRS